MTPSTDENPPFAGRRNALSFLSVTEDGGPGLYRIDIALDPTRADRPVVFTRRLADRAPAEARITRGVLEWRVRDLRISYFGADEANAEPAWHDRWEGVNYLPKLVRLLFETADGPPRPPLVIRLWNAG